MFNNDNNTRKKWNNIDKTLNNVYLQIHDGYHGFSKSLGKFCGTDFPPIIYSSDRYLWLHFHADENIEYEGFQAEYKFIPKPASCK